MKTPLAYAITGALSLSFLSSAAAFPAKGFGGCGNTCDDRNIPINVFTGNAYRQIVDLQVWGGVAEHQLQFIRHGNSREVDPKHSFGTSFGTAHHWSHNYEYLMRDEGFSSSRQPQIRVFFPDGSSNLFTQDQSDPTLWFPEAQIDRRLFQDGNVFPLQMPNGGTYPFEKLTDAQGRFFYQLQDFRDSEQNTYSFTYDAAGRFSRITEPGGRFLEVTYTHIAGRTVIGKVETADLRSVTYGYTIFNDGVRSWVELTSAIYGDGTQAAYS